MKKKDRRNLTKHGDGIETEPDPLVVWGPYPRVRRGPEMRE